MKKTIAKFDKAVEIYKVILNDSNIVIPLLAASYYYCGLAHLHLGGFGKANKNLLEADRLCPNNQEIIQALKDVQIEIELQKKLHNTSRNIGNIVSCPINKLSIG
ncbi:MAG: hypothetical protein LBH43_17085 [Treponema sp.]|nr:hypothetical protein [Treponema sp.]